MPHSQQPLSFADAEPYAFHDTWVPRPPEHVGEQGPVVYLLGANIQIIDHGASTAFDTGGGGVGSQGPADLLEERTEEEWGELEERLAEELRATLRRSATSEVA